MKFIAFLCLLLSLFTVSCKEVKSPSQTKQEEENARELENAVRDMREENQRKFEEDGTIAGNTESMDRVIDAAKKMEKESSGEQASAGQLLRIWMTMMQRDTKVLEDSASLITEGTSYGRIKNLGDIDQMSESINRYRSKNKEIAEKVKHGWLTEFRSTASKEGASGDIIDQFLEGLRPGYNRLKPHLLAIRKSDEDLCVAVLEQHAVLKKYWGKWEWNTALEAPDFMSDESLEAYNAVASKIQNAITAQTKAQQRVMEIQKKNR